MPDPDAGIAYIVMVRIKRGKPSRTRYWTENPLFIYDNLSAADATVDAYNTYVASVGIEDRYEYYSVPFPISTEPHSPGDLLNARDVIDHPDNIPDSDGIDSLVDRIPSISMVERRGTNVHPSN